MAQATRVWELRHPPPGGSGGPWLEAQMDLVVKSVHRSKTLLHTPLHWQLIRSCPKPLLLVGSETRKRRKSSWPSP